MVFLPPGASHGVHRTGLPIASQVTENRHEDGAKVARIVLDKGGGLVAVDVQDTDQPPGSGEDRQPPREKGITKQPCPPWEGPIFRTRGSGGSVPGPPGYLIQVEICKGKAEPIGKDCRLAFGVPGPGCERQ